MAKLLASHSQNALCEMSKGIKAALGRRPMYPELEDRLPCRLKNHARKAQFTCSFLIILYYLD